MKNLQVFDWNRAGASNGGWQVVFGDKVTEHHFCNSHLLCGARWLSG